MSHSIVLPLSRAVFPAILLASLGAAGAQGAAPPGTVAARPQQLTLGVTFARHSLEGALVLHVYRGSPAAQAGLRSGDRILETNGKEVTGYEDVIHATEGAAPRTPLNLLVSRSGARMVISPLLGEWQRGMVPATEVSQPNFVTPPMYQPRPSPYALPGIPYYRLTPADIDDQHSYGG